MTRSPRTRFQSLLIRILLVTVCALSAAGNVRATEPVLTSRAKVNVSPVGEVLYEVEFKTKTKLYTTLKSKTTNFQLLARKIGMDGKGWVNQDNVNGKFNDMSNAIHVSYRTPGGARPVRGDRWVLNLGKRNDLQLVSTGDAQASLMSVQKTDLGVGTMIFTIDLPKGAKNISFNAGKCELSYDFKPEIEQGDSPQISMEVDHKSELMTSLAKCYGNRNFRNMWAARSIFENTGDQTLHNYRVRFRVAELGGWSGWQRTSHVYPGQTVVDPFFPIFDLDKMMSLNGTRPAMIEVEYQYEENDGEKVTETDAFPVKVLSRNEVVFSSFSEDEMTGYHDMFDYGPALMASFTTPGDPVIQQLAGRLSGVAAKAAGRTISASTSDDDCFLFIASIHTFINANKIAYQTPPGFMSDRKFGQHIKYGRDVLRNRAGTCVDLAITWASVFEAVGLDPVIVMIPGHAYPAVRLPESGKLVAIESTAIGKPAKEAVTIGMKNLKELSSKPHFLVDIKKRRSAGIVPLDLPNVSDDYLEDLGYHFDLVKTNTNTNTSSNQRQTSPSRRQHVRGQNFPSRQLVPNGEAVDPASLVGSWVGSVTVNGIEEKVVLVLHGNGRFGVTYRDTDQNGAWEEETLWGTWAKLNNGELRFTWGSEIYDYEFNYDGEYIYIEATDHAVAIAMTRIN